MKQRANMAVRALALAMCGAVIGGRVAAAEAEDPVHGELRALRAELVAAVTAGDADVVMKHVHPDVVVTWQTNEVCRGREALRAFFEKTGREAFQGYEVPPTPDGLTLLYGGDTGVSFGETVAKYRLLGKEFGAKSRWTATLVKHEGRWKLAAYHLSMNVMDNALLDGARGAVWVSGAVALAAGLGAGVYLGRRRK
jgi:uncharacterized protein (TIGR02246 family)